MTTTPLAAGIRLGRMPYGILGNLETLEFDGEGLSMSGRVAPVGDGDRVATLAVRREQLLGLASPWDTTTQPIIVRDDPSITGHYADLSVRTDIDHMGSGHFRWQLSGRRLLGRDVPGHELHQVGGLRSNSHAVLVGSVSPWAAIPAAATEFFSGESSASSTFDLTRVSDTGSVGFYIYATGFNRRIAYFVCPPENHWDGAALITLGASLHPVTGRQVWDSDAATNSWRIGNGLVRVSQSATAGELLVESIGVANSTWTPENYSLRYDAAGSLITAFTTFTVLVNTPEVCSVRVGMRAGANRHRQLLDITVRRGDRLAEFTWRTDENLLGRVSHDPAEAATDLTVGAATVGIRETAGALPKWVIYTPAAATTDTVNGTIERTTQWPSFPFAIGMTNATDSTDDLRKYYLGVNECWQSLVGR